MRYGDKLAAPMIQVNFGIIHRENEIVAIKREKWLAHTAPEPVGIIHYSPCGGGTATPQKRSHAFVCFRLLRPKAAGKKKK